MVAKKPRTLQWQSFVLEHWLKVFSMPQLAKKHDLNKASWGYELEIGDIPKSTKLPETLGTWDYSETDIVNLKEPYKHIAADPLGISPPVGGEINTYPTSTIDGQLNIIDSLVGLFKRKGSSPTACNSVMEAHIHVHIPGLMDDIRALKRLTRYIGNNHNTVVEKCVAYVEHPLMKQTKSARTYLKWDMGRRMPEYMISNILNHATDFKSFIKLQCCGKDAVSMGRPFRYCINTYCLKHIGTIEFRCFRATLDLDLIRNCFLFVREFMDAALNSGPSAQDLISSNGYVFPEFKYQHDVYSSWEKTKWSLARGKKVRKFVKIT